MGKNSKRKQSHPPPPHPKQHEKTNKVKEQNNDLEETFENLKFEDPFEVKTCVSGISYCFFSLDFEFRF